MVVCVHAGGCSTYCEPMVVWKMDDEVEKRIFYL